MWLDTIEENIHELEDTGNKNTQSETQNEEEIKIRLSEQKTISNSLIQYC